MDKGWTSLPRHTEGYQHGVNSFLDFAFSKGRPQGQEILCPCSICNNFSWGRRDEVYDHLISKGFQKSYTVWVHHGERISRMDSETDESEVHEGLVDDIHGLLNETFRHVLEGDKDGDGPNEDAKKFYNLLEEGKQELYPGCKKFLTLSFVIRLYLLKTLNGWSNASFTALLELLKEAIPHLNIPDSFNKIKAMVKDLGLGYNKIHACPNDCVLFRDTYEDEEFCPICGASRYIENVEVDIEVDKLKKKPVPAKVLRHFPLIPRLKKLFMCSKIAESLRWHDEHRSKDGKLRHPADGQSWKDFDRLHPDFAEESRNIRLGLASDGFNPFRTMSISHSTWPVVLVAYNLPPWCCMKPEYVMMSLLIPGPCSPGKSIDVYLQPLIEELKVLWEVGVETYDASKNKTFQLHAALLWTISDFPAYVMLSGWSTKGKLACPCCNYDTSSCYLKHSRKMCYMDHRIFLGMDHPYRMDKRSFNGNVELRSSPALLDGEQIFEDLKDFDNVFGKKQKNKIDGPWKKRSIFFELPYWKQNTLRHCLDVMHIEKNVCDNIIGTLLDIPGKSKDHANARYDLKDMGIRKNLQPKEIDGGKKAKIAKACFNLTNQEKTIFCDILKSVKLPSSSSSNISRCVHVAEKKISGYKSHDAHFMLHYLLQVAIKCTMQNQVAGPLIYLGSFFRSLCQKVVENDTIDHLEVDIREILCQLERIFPPSFFDIMVHLPIHLVNELRLGGPVQFRWMYPIERYLCRLKSYVRNKSRPEGSIAEGYLAEECLTFCSRYLSPNVDTRLSRRTQNYDNCSEADVCHDSYFASLGRPIGGKRKGQPFSLDTNSKIQAHQEYEEHVNNQTKGRKWKKAKTLSHDFSEWFKERASHEDVPKQLKDLSRGPNTVAKRFSSYVINGYKF
ncbi:uncharacterized protein [Arachis hypogaea]|uniref:uncharacterized protein n=1 Tax=Arachis hypogaea TaxID=3818 RepID=UPI000DECCBDD|nr:uncharacterized protein LOC112735314 [Arachis hypogaea]